MLDVGDDAPEFELSNQDGETVRLSDFEGCHLVLYFYPRANTEQCTIEAEQFETLGEEFESCDAAIIGVSDDPVEDLKAFADDYDLSFDLLADERGEVATRYESYGEKQLFGNTFDGVFRNTYVIGPDGTIVATFADVSADGHAADVLSEIETR